MTLNGEIDYFSAAERPVDDGSGTVKLWRIEDFERVLITDEDQIGQFYDGDSYIVLYTYEIPPSDEKHYIIYFWQGRNSTADERGASAIYAVEMDEDLGGKPVQVRVTQGREPGHFRSIFSGGMIVHRGGVASGFRNRNDEDEYDEDGCCFYHIKGNTELNTYGVAVDEVSSSLNSCDCFVLIKDGTTTLWIGSCSNESESAVAMKIALRLSGGDPSAVNTVMEGEEPEEFWDALGGKSEYPELRPDEPQPSEPRLFECSDALGEFAVSEVTGFVQGDLMDESVMILDCGTSIFVWIGSKSNQDERTKSMDSAKKFLAESAEDRDQDVPIITVMSGLEPPLFTQYFIGWDPDLLQKTTFVDPYEKKLAQLKAAEDDSTEEDSGNEETNPDASEENSTDVDPTQRELTLSDEEFAEAFGMSKDEFYELPKWKQIAKKKEAGLF